MSMYKPISVSPHAPMRVRPRPSMEAVGAEQEVKSFDQVKHNFEIKGSIGRGVFGVVAKVIDLRNNKECALKRPTRNLDIERECEMMERLNKSSGVAPQLYECGSDYILMELINGKTLTTWLDGQDLEKIPGMMRTYADLIDTIHDAGIVHGDLNTGNIIVTPSGWTAIDFGFSMSKKEDSESWDTIAATLLVISGSLFYPKGPELEDLQKNLRSWIKGVKDTSDIRDIADHIESSLEPAKAEFDESEGPIDEFLRRLTSLIKQ